MPDPLYAAIEARHPTGQWLLFLELRCGTGYKAVDAERRIDAYAIHQWPSAHNLRVAYEVKASRSDFLRELRQPWKRRGALRFSNHFWFVTPPGTVNLPELPAAAGLIEVGPDGQAAVVVDAPYRESLPPTWNFLAAVARHAGAKAVAA